MKGTLNLNTLLNLLTSFLYSSSDGNEFTEAINNAKETSVYLNNTILGVIYCTQLY